MDRTRTFSWEDPLASAERGRELSGIEYMRKVASGEFPSAPIARLLDMKFEVIGEGHVIFRLTPAEWMYNPIGTVHGGVAATILDSCMGCAVHTTLPAGTGYSTTDLQVRYLGAMSAETGLVLAEGKVVHLGGRVATAEGRLYTQSDERLLASGTTGCLVMRPS